MRTEKNEHRSKVSSVRGFTEEEMDRFERIVFDLENDSAECAECGFSQDVETDADYPCPECGKGRLTSSMRKAGLI
jgi:predicted RNA-binding Zn-ribbon protein involved in translation (DUF1610 family)